MSAGTRLTLVAGTLVAGEVTGFALERVAVAWQWAAAALVLALLVTWGWRVPYMLFPLAFALGVVLAARLECKRAESLENHWRSAVGGKVPTLELTVEGGVEERELKKRGRVVQFFSSLGPTPLKVVLPCEGLARLPSVGEVWRCGGWVSRAAVKDERFARRMFWARSGERVTEGTLGRMERTGERFARLGDVCARKAAVGLGWCPELAALDQAILLGRRADIPHARREVFVAAGTVHVFAISGLHVMLIAWMLSNALLYMGVPARIQGVLVLPVLVAYVLLTGARPSAVRAAMMAGMYLLAGVVGRKGDSLTAWAITALAVYGISPDKVYDTGCLLSFTVMLGIVLWIRWSREVVPEGAWRDGVVALGVSLAAWAAGVPIAARVFGRFTLGGLVANLAVLRLAPLTVAFGMVGMLAGFVCEPVAVLFNNLAAGSTFLMMMASALVAGVPVSSLEVAPWTIAACVAWYVTIGGGAFVLGRVFMRHRARWWGR